MAAQCFLDIGYCSWILFFCLATGVTGAVERNLTIEASDGYYHCPFMFQNVNGTTVHTALTCSHGCCGTVYNQKCCTTYTPTNEDDDDEPYLIWEPFTIFEVVVSGIWGIDVLLLVIRMAIDVRERIKIDSMFLTDVQPRRPNEDERNESSMQSDSSPASFERF